MLMQVAFHSVVAAERDDETAFTIDDVAGAIVDKLVRRHPHVFGDVTVSGADEVNANWEQIKAAERAEKGGAEASALDGVPMGQPALSLAAQLQRRAARIGAPPSWRTVSRGTSRRTPRARRATWASVCSRWSARPPGAGRTRSPRCARSRGYSGIVSDPGNERRATEPGDDHGDFAQEIGDGVVPPETHVYAKRVLAGADGEADDPGVVGGVTVGDPARAPVRPGGPGRSRRFFTRSTSRERRPARSAGWARSAASPASSSR